MSPCRYAEDAKTAPAAGQREHSEPECLCKKRPTSGGAGESERTLSCSKIPVATLFPEGLPSAPS